jgi:thiamine-monophosphate kinase
MNGTIADYGEQDLLKLLQGFCPSDIVGDDAAAVGLAPLLSTFGSQLVVTTDVLVEQVHFSNATTPADAVGWRAVAANLSDLAAMGAEVLGITVGLALPASCPLAWVLDLYQGMTRCLDQHGRKQQNSLCKGILGGDLCRSATPTIAITALGLAPPQYVLYRHGLQVGDQLVVTGVHGASRAGLAILLGEMALHPEQSDRWIQAHQYPQARLEVLSPLRSIQDHLSPQRSLGGMDSSDGLADAVLQLCRASGVGAILDRAELPLAPGLADEVGEAKAVEWCLYGGEDFELVLGLPADYLQSFLAVMPQAQWIGAVTTDPAVILRDSRSPEFTTSLSFAAGFQHF